MIDRNLLSAVQDLNFWHRPQETGFNRRETRAVMEFAQDPDFALVLSGVRRAGKTYLARQVLREQAKAGEAHRTLYVNFEDPALATTLNTAGLETLYRTYRHCLNSEGPAWVVLDEVHNVPDWEKWVRITLEKKEKVKFIVTGSCSVFPQASLGTTLTGRTMSLQIFPLCFRDFLSFKGRPPRPHESSAAMEPGLDEYLVYGSFPMIVLMPQAAKKSVYLKELFDDIVSRDVILRNRLRDSHARQAAAVIASQFAGLLSVQRMENFLKDLMRTRISPTTVNRWLRHFEECFLFLLLPIHSRKVREVLLYPRKAYCVDPGLLHAVGVDPAGNMGRLYENAVAVELCRRHGPERVRYWRDASQREVDFLVKDQFRVLSATQVCYDAKAPATRTREQRSLLSAMREFGLQDGTLVTRDEEGRETVDGRTIRLVPLWRWLATPDEPAREE